MAEQANKLTGNEIEAANRAEATALLIRTGYRVYRPEADCYGEDLLVRTPRGDLLSVQLKGRLTADWMRYGGHSLWMLFPGSKFKTGVERKWFLVPHDRLYEWLKGRHAHTPKWKELWNCQTVGKPDAEFLDDYAIIPSSDPK
jgi:hypothetical protein